MDGRYLGIIKSEERVNMEKESSLSYGIESFTIRIKELMGDKSLRSFALSIDASEGGVRKWFTQGTIPSFDKMVRIARLHNVNLDWLCTGEGPKFPADQDFSQVRVDSQRLGADVGRVEIEVACVKYTLTESFGDLKIQAHADEILVKPCCANEVAINCKFS